MKSKIALIFALTLLLGINGSIITAQTEVDVQSSSITIGIARGIENEDFDENIMGFKETLQEYGFVEGVNVE